VWVASGTGCVAGVASAGLVTAGLAAIPACASGASTAGVIATRLVTPVRAKILADRVNSGEMSVCEGAGTLFLKTYPGPFGSVIPNAVAKHVAGKTLGSLCGIAEASQGPSPAPPTGPQLYGTYTNRSSKE
jgi:hypothetical protein